jgi:DNA-binding GntR family transcriptional regulator
MNAIKTGSDLSSQDRAYRYIRERIIGAEFKPNQKLRAQDIAARLRTSRTPVREALGRLTQDGLVEKHDGWGYIVTPLTVGAILNLFRVREALEVEAIHEALPNVEKALLGRLAEHLATSRALLAQRHWSEFLAESRRFHQAIATATGNPLLQAMLQSITARIQVVGGMLVEKYVGRADEILEENGRILHALTKRDRGAAEAAVRAHIQRGRDRVMQHLGHEDIRLYVSGSAHA